MANEGGVWRTVRGRRVFIKDGQSLTDAMKASGKFDDNDKKGRLQKRLKERLGKNGEDDTKQKHEAAIKELSGDKYGDGTYDIDKMEAVNFEEGYQVTFCQIGDDYSPAEYGAKVNEFVKVSSDGKTYAGKFESTPEISFHLKDKEEAIRLAKKYNQISVWDWGAGDEIKTGGTGRR